MAKATHSEPWLCSGETLVTVGQLSAGRVGLTPTLADYVQRRFGGRPGPRFLASGLGFLSSSMKSTPSASASLIKVRMEMFPLPPCCSMRRTYPAVSTPSLSASSFWVMPVLTRISATFRPTLRAILSAAFSSRSFDFIGIEIKLLTHTGGNIILLPTCGYSGAVTELPRGGAQRRNGA